MHCYLCVAQVEARVRLRATALGGVSPAEGVPVKLVPHPTQVLPAFC